MIPLAVFPACRQAKLPEEPEFQEIGPIYEADQAEFLSEARFDT